MGKEHTLEFIERRLGVPVRVPKRFDRLQILAGQKGGGGNFAF